MRRVIVTGGAGFIGSNFIHCVLLEHEDWAIVNFDKLTYAGNPENLKDIEDNPQYTFVKGDIADPRSVEAVFKEYSPHYVVNFAAETHVDRSILDASPFIETNVKGTQVLLEAARRHAVERFLQVSTDEVYGSLGQTGVFTERTPLAPNSPYAASKAAADLLCRAYWKTYGIQVIVSRSSNNYGPYQFPEKLIPLMIRNALAGEPLPIYGEGKQVRDWIYVEDNCHAIDLVLREGEPGEAYNIGGSCEKQNIDVVKAICSILNEKLALDPSRITHHRPLDELVEFIEDPRGLAHDFRYALDSSKVTRELGWVSRVDFDAGLKRTVEWYLQNQDWVGSVITGEYQEYYDRVYGKAGEKTDQRSSP